MKEELVKDKDCIDCAKFFKCKGKPRGVNCVSKEVRNGGEKVLLAETKRGLL